MRFQVLGHAGLRINSQGRELLCDPWVIGSCYWRSWWNYPPVPAGLPASLAPQFIYLTHLHWDHFHGPSLRLFPESTQFYVPYIRYDRMRRDLLSMGFKNIRELPHAKRIELAPGFAIRSYHFGPVFTDSALVIEADGITLFNANDAKLAGLPLRQILSDYPNIDFCLRSHSSANARRSMHYESDTDSESDDDSHYLATFSLFMNRVRPRYAIPFASNSCFLHRDARAMNEFSQTPLSVKRYFEQFATRRKLATKLQIMIPGDEWSMDNQFTLSQDNYFENRETRLQEYAATVATSLDEFYVKESKTRVSGSLIERFFTDVWRRTPYFLRRRIVKERILIVSVNETTRDYFEIELRSGKVQSVAVDRIGDYRVRIEFPALILVQSIRINMLSQAWISKRVHFYTTRSKEFVLSAFLRILDFNEAEALPLHRMLSFRTIRALLPRWREALLYLHVILHLLRRRSFVEIEARLLEA